MFVHFEILSKGYEPCVSEIMVSKVEDVLNLMVILENSETVIAYKLLNHEPNYFGWDGQPRNKLKEDKHFTKEEWDKAGGEIYHEYPREGRIMDFNGQVIKIRYKNISEDDLEFLHPHTKKKFMTCYKSLIL